MLTRKYHDVGSYVADSTLNDCQSLRFTWAAGGMVYVPTGSNITGLTFYGSPDGQSEFCEVGDEVTVAAGTAVAIPDAVFGAGFIKIRTTAGTEGSVRVSFKG